MSSHDARDFRIDMQTLPARVEARALGSGGFAYNKKLKREPYEKELRLMQIELVRLLHWAKAEGERIVVLFEGRDAAGKGGAIKRLTAHLNPRVARVVALPSPTTTEATQWYFQRYVEHLPARGEMTIFDRSWYNRAGVEPVFGFCTQAQTDHFLKAAPQFEAMLARDGVRLVKFFLTIGREMQMKRLHARWRDPLHRWKVSRIDEKAIEKWSDYSTAFDRMLRQTDAKIAPWTVIRANDKRRARLECIRHLLDVTPYKHKNEELVRTPDDKIALAAERFLAEGGEEA